MKHLLNPIQLILLLFTVPALANAQVSPDAVNKDLLTESVDAVLGKGHKIKWIQKPVPESIKKSLEKNFKIKQSVPDTLYVGKVQVQDERRYLIPDIAPSKSEKYSFVLYLNGKKEVVDVDVLEYRENYGYEIDYEFFREQFHGKKNPQKVRFGRTIQNISGATISARSLTYAVHDLLTIIQKIDLN